MYVVFTYINLDDFLWKMKANIPYMDGMGHDAYY